MKLNLERGKMILQCEGPEDELYLAMVLGIGGPGVDITLSVPKVDDVEKWGAATLSPKRLTAPQPTAVAPPAKGKKQK